MSRKFNKMTVFKCMFSLKFIQKLEINAVLVITGDGTQSMGTSKAISQTSKQGLVSNELYKTFFNCPVDLS